MQPDEPNAGQLLLPATDAEPANQPAVPLNTKPLGARPKIPIKR